METYTVTTARTNLYQLLGDVTQNHTPIQITGKSGSAVLISSEDWRAIEETLFLHSIPGMTDSILAASQEPVSDCIPLEEVEW